MKPCLTLTERSQPALQKKLRAYADRAPYIEVRLDLLDRPEIPTLPEVGTTQFIATCRPSREGGQFQGEETDRLHLLAKAGESGFDWIDLEHDVEKAPSLPGQVKVLRSLHDLESCPDNLPAAFDKAGRYGGDLVKLAVTVQKSSDLIRLLRFMESLPAASPRVVLGMGSVGQPSRYLGFLLGNQWTYLAEEREASAAAGQFTLLEAEDSLSGRHLEENPLVFGVLGSPVAHSLSPAIHNSLFRQHGFNGVYFPFHVESLPEWFEYVRASKLGFSGFSITLPLKTAAPACLDQVDSIVGAVNTAVRLGNRWLGFNTDLPGFLGPLKRSMELTGRTAVVIGNGGVAHTAVAALRGEGVKVTVAGRNLAKVRAFAQLYDCPSCAIEDLPLPADLMVNTTPVGQFPDVVPSPVRAEQIDCSVAYDLVYHPTETTFLRMAANRGARTISGIEMFVEQAAHQFRYWTSIEPDIAPMLEVSKSALKKFFL
jgi:3-dehydroquinate dehydratase/shikimate dehydrogenase